MICIMKNDGYKIVLTADRTLMSEYGGGIFLGFSATVPMGLMPDALYFSLFCPSVNVDDGGRVEVAPCGTRRIEAALLSYGFKEEDLAVVHPDHLRKAVGRRTKVVGVTEIDPLGKGPATSTFTEIFGGEAYMSSKFIEVLNDPAVARFRPKIVVGGPGAWQLESEETLDRLGIHHLIVGEGERVVGPLFEKIVDGQSPPRIVHGDVVPEHEIPTIRAPTIHGVVEISRGCGRGCAFCVPTLQRYRCLPIDHILREVEVNLRAGRQPLLHGEDVLRYKAKGLDVNKEAVLNLFKAVKGHPGVERVSISHFALSSVVSAPSLVEEISEILDVGNAHTPWFSGQTGIETGSPKLMRGHMLGKCRPYPPESWPDVVVTAFQMLSDNSWVPVATLITGLPGEDLEDIDLTIQLIERLQEYKSLIVPLFFVAEGALEEKADSFTLKKMTRAHGELFVRCWRHNLRWAPNLLREYLDGFGGNGLKIHVMRLFASQVIKNAARLLSRCEEEYDYDLARMIGDIRAGKTSTLPQPLRAIYHLQRLSQTRTSLRD
jgi:radical SAM superfamily enzyme YgiQ (UPF0313 family)